MQTSHIADKELIYMRVFDLLTDWADGVSSVMTRRSLLCWCFLAVYLLTSRYSLQQRNSLA